MHLMLDLETLSTENNAVITQIGWCLFDPTNVVIGGNASGCFWPDPAQQILNGRNVSYSTIQWWMKQDDAARAKFEQKSDNPFRVAGSFNVAFDWANIYGVWGHGATFDPVLLADFLKRYGVPTPWKYNQVRDTRTLFWLLPTEMEKARIKHSAQDDAVAQATTVQKAFARFQEMRNKEAAYMGTKLT